MRVRTDLGGCICAVYLTEGGDPAYVIAYHDTRHPGVSFLEVVVAGLVRNYEPVPDEGAPARICLIMRTWARGGYQACLDLWAAERELHYGLA